MKIYPREGRELKILKDIRNQSWVIDASMGPVPRGPNIIFIDMERKEAEKVFGKLDIKSEDLIEVIKKIFPKTLSSRFAQEDSTVVIEAPVAEVFPDFKEFSNYWLKLRIELVGYWQPSSVSIGAESFRIMIDSLDGYLPRWPGREDAPPAEHTKQFHLDLDGKDKFHNFYIMKKTNDAIVDYFKKTAYASVYDPR